MRKLTRVFIVLLVLVGTGTTASGRPPEGSGLDAAIRAQERVTERLLARRNIVGTAVGLNAAGDHTVLVLTTRPGVRIRGSFAGVPVTVKVTGPLEAVHHRPGHSGGPGGGGGGGSDPAPSPTARHERPVPIGISTGNAGECSAGTIGARVRSGNTVYALSNNHVYALENAAPIGSEVLQPGRYDTGCSYTSSNVIGSLAAFVPINFGGTANRVDAAIASTTTANLGTSTPSGGYGTPSSNPVAPALNTAIQKYGRTTALTSGVITGINATVRVGYSSGTATFTGQVIMESLGGPLLKAGDSGSLAVTSSGNRPVGLLFAGSQSGKLGVANDIRDVLSLLGVTIDGS